MEEIIINQNHVITESTILNSNNESSRLFKNHSFLITIFREERCIDKINNIVNAPYFRLYNSDSYNNYSASIRIRLDEPKVIYHNNKNYDNCLQNISITKSFCNELNKCMNYIIKRGKYAGKSVYKSLIFEAEKLYYPYKLNITNQPDYTQIDNARVGGTKLC